MTEATTTITIPAQELEQARAKLEKAHGLLSAMIRVAINSKTLCLKDADGSMQGHCGHLNDINAAIEAALKVTAQDNQTND